MGLVQYIKETSTQEGLVRAGSLLGGALMAGAGLYLSAKGNPLGIYLLCPSPLIPFLGFVATKGTSGQTPL